MGWFVLQTLTGQEQKVLQLIEAQAREQGLKSKISEVLMPTERVTSVKNGKKSTIVKKLFPGYIFLRTCLFNESGDRNDDVWTFIKGIQGVIGFLGEPPKEMRESEIDSIRGQVAETQEKPKPKIVFEPGEMVKIVDGPFMSSTGIVEEVDPDRGRLKVLVSIFGGNVPVDLEYWQVERDEPFPSSSSQVAQ